MRARIILMSVMFGLGVSSALGQVRVPAEWEPHRATWMQWPRGIETSYRPDFANIIGVLQDYEPVNILVRNATMRTQASNYLSNRGIPLGNVSFHIYPYDWAWMRDNGPVWIESNGQQVIQDWGFDAWGQVMNTWALDDAVPCTLAGDLAVGCENYNNYILERGSAEFNGVDAVIVSWVVQSARNPGWSRSASEALLKQAWGVDTVVWLEGSAPTGDITEGHVDGIARFIDVDTVVVAREPAGSPDAAVYDDAAAVIAAAGFEVLRLDNPGSILYFGEVLPVSYINWLVGNGVVIVPGFNHPTWDAQAAATIQGFFPGRDVHVVDCREIWYWGGGVHCVTNDQPALLVNCQGDTNQDGLVDVTDLAQLLSEFGRSGADLASDFDESGNVGLTDLGILLANFGRAC